MTVFVENTEESTKTLLVPISGFSKSAGYKIGTQKLIAFLYTTNG